MPLDEPTRTYLRERLRRADAILFTGAGFARSTKNRAGNPMPLGDDLKPHLWKLCYPGDVFDPTSKLDDLFGVAKSRNARALRDLLNVHLSVNPDSIPVYYAELLSLPWHRVYTLNVDDMVAAISRRYPLRRQLLPLSALKWDSRPLGDEPARLLELVHLNGMLEDAPEGVTFSPTQYAERLAGQEPLYAQCAADVLSRPVIFIGTPLNESPLWQHVRMRKKGPQTRREFRRQSYLVTPTLDRPRRETLDREFHVTHLALTAEDFARELLVIARESAEEGHRLLASLGTATSSVQEVPLAQEIAATSKPGAADYLLGRAPSWGDVRDGIAAPRECDVEVERLAFEQARTPSGRRSVLFIAGTAGSGKSTLAMRLALSLSAKGQHVGWVDYSVDIAPLDLRRSMAADARPGFLVIDEADRYGVELAPLLLDLIRSAEPPTVVVTMRSGRGADRFSDRARVLDLPIREFAVPHLADSDIGALLDTLDRNNRLGVLKGRARRDQEASFREAAGRQLIVAMLETTSGRRFEELIVSELQELPNDTRDIYALAAVASALRFGLTRDELLLALGDATSDTLGAIDTLQRREQPG